MNTATWADFVAMDPQAQVRRALDVMAEVVAEYGSDHVYQREGASCRYVHPTYDEHFAMVGSEPGCLVGQVLYRLGLGLDTMAARDRNQIDAGIGGWSDLGLSQDTLTVLDSAQSVQDSGQPWGKALILAQDTAQHMMA